MNTAGKIFAMLVWLGALAVAGSAILALPATAGVALFVVRLAINLDQLLDFEKALRIGYKAIDL